MIVGQLEVREMKSANMLKDAASPSVPSRD